MDPILGTIILFAGNFAPQGWALCNGQLLPINQNAALFSILGTTYGGNGQTTFALPDLRGRVPVSAGQAVTGTVYVLGETGGVETVTLTQTQMPMHNHLMSASTSALGNASLPTNAYLADGGAATKIYASSATSGVTLNVQAISQAGGSQPHQNMQPFLAMNYIIATQGVFPVRP